MDSETKEYSKVVVMKRLDKISNEITALENSDRFNLLKPEDKIRIIRANLLIRKTLNSVMEYPNEQD